MAITVHMALNITNSNTAIVEIGKKDFKSINGTNATIVEATEGIMVFLNKQKRRTKLILT